MATLLVTHQLWLPLLGAALIVADPLAPADVIVPLAGDRARVKTAAVLWRSGYAPCMAFADMWVDAQTPPGRYAELVIEQARGLGVSPEAITIAPGAPATTYEEARDLRRLAERKHWRSMIVVTSTYHTRRSRAILNDVFANSGIVVRLVPVIDDPYQPETWWRSVGGWQTTLSEYMKLILFYLGYHRFEGARDV